MFVICSGMYRSGSTWQYQVACELLARGGRPHQPLGFYAEAKTDEYLAADPTVWHLFKVHQPDPLFAQWLRDGLAVGLYSYRDLRDVAYSMAHKLGSDFRGAVEEGGIVDLCLSNDSFWTTLPRILIQRYEDRVPNGDRRAVMTIAGHLGIYLAPAALDEVARAYSLDRNRERTERLADQLRGEGVDLADRANALRYDPATLLHWNHLRDGRVGSWRDVATPQELAVLREKCGHWLVDRGYEPDDRWASAARVA